MAWVMKRLNDSNHLAKATVVKGSQRQKDCKTIKKPVTRLFYCLVTFAFHIMCMQQFM